MTRRFRISMTQTRSYQVEMTEAELRELVPEGIDWDDPQASHAAQAEGAINYDEPSSLYDDWTAGYLLEGDEWRVEEL